jgi:site-specific recombinase XerD
MDAEVFPTVLHHRGRPVTHETLGRGFAAVIKDAGLPKEYTPHILRHTCATWMLWEGKSVMDVAKFIGATMHEIDKTYGHHQLEIELERERRA